MTMIDQAKAREMQTERDMMSSAIARCLSESKGADPMDVELRRAADFDPDAAADVGRGGFGVSGQDGAGLGGDVIDFDDMKAARRRFMADHPERSVVVARVEGE